MSSVGVKPAVHEVKYDDTPITLHALDISDRLQREGPSLPFASIFEGRTRGQMIGLFLALLELIRQKRIRVEQSDRCGEIIVHLLDATPITATADDELDVADEEPDEAEAFREEESPFETEEETLIPAEEEEEDEDDFGRKLKSIEIGDVDLGRSAESDEPPPADESADEDS
jgi:hypothetical protein